MRAGQIALADWRGDVLPKEPTKLRPVVVDDGLFAPAYPNAILVPLTDDGTLVLPDLSVAIMPPAENGCAIHAGPFHTWSRRHRSCDSGRLLPG